MPSPTFALNHITAPYEDFPGLLELAGTLGLRAVEIRNDLDGVPIADGTPATELREQAAEAGISILSINALQRFEQWNRAREAEAVALAGYARDAGVGALVLCPTNSVDDERDAGERRRDLRRALAGLAPVLADHGLVGLVEPLGFAECALRRKRCALDAIDETGTEGHFRLLHDTFHHAISGEQEIFPGRIGLVHVSGVEDAAVAVEAMRDTHRLLVGPADRLDNAGQLRALIAGGYAGAISFEAFSSEVHDADDAPAALERSLAYLCAAIR
ncbi:TIM barrel protein [Lichenicoccus sp.]|uniref:TIM barrel protein n=1 Tax=Lichenicoccus sp. TaxID=2781899 RepID=UPI003D0F0947